MPHLTTPPEIRFWNKVKKQPGDGCWEWQGCITKNGYGRFGVLARKLSVWTHRYALELAGIEIPPGMCACHKCDNRKCVRPDHLFVGTLADNVRDMRAKGRNRTCPNPEKFSPRGSKHYAARFTESQVVEIRKRYAEGGISFRKLGTLYNSPPEAIAKIVWRKTWTHV